MFPARSLTRICWYGTGFAQVKRVSLRIMALDIPPQDVITRDNVSLKVNAVLYMKVELKWDCLWATLCLVGAVYFMFRGN